VDEVGDELRRAYERVIVSFSTGNTDALDELLDDDIIDHNPMPDQAPGREGSSTGCHRPAAPSPTCRPRSRAPSLRGIWWQGA
jgi:hypothetical protein